MRRLLLVSFFYLISFALIGQSFEVSGIADNYFGTIGESLKAPLRIRNNGDRPVTLVIRRIDSQLGTTQKNFFCINGNCLDSKVEEYQIRIEPGQTTTALEIGLEAGIAPGFSSSKYLIYNRYSPTDSYEFEMNFAVDEKKPEKNIYTSRAITVQDVYPNPVTDFAFIDYRILNDQINAKITLHNILGNVLGEYELPTLENKIKVRTETLSSGIYFYTLYVDNEAVMTRKIVVKK
jgi:hypothetical protein